MGKIVISTNMSLNGVVQDPDGAEGFDRGGWFVRHGGSDLDAWREVVFAEARASGALLFGRRSHAWFAERWSKRPGPWADRLRALPKYVVTSTPLEAAWENSAVLTGDVAQGVARLKQELSGDLVVYASYPLVRALLALLAPAIRVKCRCSNNSPGCDAASPESVTQASGLKCYRRFRLHTNVHERRLVNRPRDPFDRTTRASLVDSRGLSGSCLGRGCRTPRTGRTPQERADATDTPAPRA